MTETGQRTLSWWIGLTREELNAAARLRRFRHVQLDPLTCADKEAFFARRTRAVETREGRGRGAGFDALNPSGGGVTLLRGGEASPREVRKMFEVE